MNGKRTQGRGVNWTSAVHRTTLGLMVGCGRGRFWKGNPQRSPLGSPCQLPLIAHPVTGELKGACLRPATCAGLVQKDMPSHQHSFANLSGTERG
jgi:hypothetical protein